MLAGLFVFEAGVEDFKKVGGSMKLLEERILKDGNVLGESISKVDSF